MGGPAGLVLGLGVATLLPVALSVLESSRDRRLRREMVRAAPLVADLLAATLAAGVPIERAVGVIARAVGGPAGEALAGVVRRQELGEPAHTAWARLDSLPGVGAIARTVARSVAGGAPLADVLGQLARDLRVAAHAEALADVRAVSVRAVLPLGLCLLPAFVLLGVVPIVGGLLPDL